MKRFFVLTAILVFMVGMASVATAQRGAMQGPCAGDKPGMRMGGHGAGFMGHCNMLSCRKDLGLTDEQVDKIEQINFAHKEAMIDIKADLEKARLKMHQEMRSDSPDKAKVLALSDEITAIEGKIAKARIEHQFAKRAVLTTEQLEKWNTCKQNCKAGCGPGGDMKAGKVGCGGPCGAAPAGAPMGDRKRDGSCMDGK